MNYIVNIVACLLFSLPAMIAGYFYQFFVIGFNKGREAANEEFD